MLVPLGGPISLVTTNLPELSMSLKLRAIFFTPYIKGDDYLARLRLHMIIFRRMINAHEVKPAELFQFVVDEGPDAVLVGINFTFTLVGAAAGAVDKALVASGYRAYTAGVCQHAGTALNADFVE